MTSTDGAAATTRELLLAAAREELVEGGRASVSLRAVARRAGVSHAAPGYFFAGRAGLLTAVATEGFVDLTRALTRAVGDVGTLGAGSLSALGHAYVDFGLTHPALYDLMFRREELHREDPDLLAAQQQSIGVLVAAVEAHDPDSPTDVALARWAFVHGLVVLARDGALAGPAGTDVRDGASLAHDLVELYA